MIIVFGVEPRVNLSGDTFINLCICGAVTSLVGQRIPHDELAMGFYTCVGAKRRRLELEDYGNDYEYEEP